LRVRPTHLLAFATALFLVTLGTAIAQRQDAFVESRSHPAIDYNSAPSKTAISELNRKLDEGQATFAFDPASGYLRSALEALNVPIDSQMLVYTKTSMQAEKINMENPRAIYFNDQVSIAWVRGGMVLEAWAQDPRQGTIFYTMDQERSAAPRFARRLECVTCHVSWETLGVPGPTVLTTFPRKSERDYADGHAVDHRSDIAELWGGWYVTGRRAPARHMGNLPLFMSPPFPESAIARSSVADAFDLAGYPSPYSDVVALMVFEHQVRVMNLITRAGWESRVAATRKGDPAIAAARVRVAVNDLVDYMLFVDETPLTERIEGLSGFAERFSALGPRDAKGRSLRELQLETRLVRYPLSYMIYSPAFDAMPEDVKAAACRRLRDVLSGRVTDPKFAHLTADLRQAIVEILRDTKTGLVEGL
jgi:hypothetical protein